MRVLRLGRAVARRYCEAGMAIAIMLVLTGCRREERAVPRPVAFPRIEIPAERYVAADSVPMHFEINASASTERREQDETVWLTITYPGYFPGTAIYCTFTPVTSENVDEVIANRTERMALNSGGADSEMTRLTSQGGLDCSMTVTRAGSATPVQFIAADNGIVVSGAMYINVDAGFAPDSIAPVVDAVSRDMLHTLKTIRHD